MELVLGSQKLFGLLRPFRQRERCREGGEEGPCESLVGLVIIPPGSAAPGCHCLVWGHSKSEAWVHRH